MRTRLRPGEGQGECREKAQKNDSAHSDLSRKTLWRNEGAWLPAFVPKRFLAHLLSRYNLILG
jgi:hypothetical protein